MGLNLFGFHMESATTGVETEDGVYDVLENPESGSVSEAILEVTEEANAVAREDAGLEQLQEGEEAIAEVQDVVRASVGEGGAVDEAGEVTGERLPTSESYGLSAIDRRLAEIVLKRHTGRKYAKSILPSMESFTTRSQARDVTQRYVQEGMKETLKRFWEAIKAQFIKLWNKIKTWYIKTFSASKKLRDKAEKLLDKVNTMSATIENKSFAFSQVANVAIDGKAKNAASITSATRNLANLLNDVMEVPVDKTMDAIDDAVSDFERDFTKNMIDSLHSKTDTTKDKQDNQETWLQLVSEDYVSAIKAAFTNYSAIINKSKPSNFQDKVLEAYGAYGGSGNRNTVTHSPTFSDVYPGDWVLIYLTPTAGSNLPPRMAITNTRDKPKEYDSSTEVDTLTQPQMKEILASISDGCESIFQYEKKWEKVDRAREKIVKAIDDVIKHAEDVIKDDGVSGTKSKAEGIVRRVSRDTIKTTKDIGNLAPSISGKAMTTFAALYNYCEQSISNYRK